MRVSVVEHIVSLGGIEMQQWRITVEFFPGSVTERDRWYWQMVEYGEIVEDGYAAYADQACEDIGWTLRKLSGDA